VRAILMTRRFALRPTQRNHDKAHNKRRTSTMRANRDSVQAQASKTKASDFFSALKP
jgi:hypothetical protein